MEDKGHIDDTKQVNLELIVDEIGDDSKRYFMLCFLLKFISVKKLNEITG